MEAAWRRTISSGRGRISQTGLRLTKPLTSWRRMRGRCSPQRARVRHRALPALEEALGPGVAEALARTAAQLRADTECLDDLAFAESGQLRANASDPAGLDASWLAALPQAIRARVLRDAAIMAGCPHGALTAGHVDRVDALVTAWRGQRWVDLPGGVRARRSDGKVWFTAVLPKDGGRPVGRT